MIRSIADGIFAVLIVIILSLWADWARADHFIPRYGFEDVSNIGKSERLFGVQYAKELGTHLLIFDLGGYKAKESSAYFALSYGYRVRFSYGFCEASFGPAVISNPDKVLGSHFQFMHSVSCGLLNKNGIALSWVHFSNAGLWRPNIGRDFIGVRFLIWAN